MTDEWEDTIYPDPTPWHATQEGQTLIAIAGIAIAVAAFGVTVLVEPTGLAETVLSYIGLVGLVVMLVFSGRAAVQAVEEMMEGSQ